MEWSLALSSPGGPLPRQAGLLPLHKRAVTCPGPLPGYQSSEKPGEINSSIIYTILRFPCQPNSRMIRANLEDFCWEGSSLHCTDSPDVGTDMAIWLRYTGTVCACVSTERVKCWEPQRSTPSPPLPKIPRGFKCLKSKLPHTHITLKSGNTPQWNSRTASGSPSLHWLGGQHTTTSRQFHSRQELCEAIVPH